MLITTITQCDNTFDNALDEYLTTIASAIISKSFDFIVLVIVAKY